MRRAAARAPDPTTETSTAMSFEMTDLSAWLALLAVLSLPCALLPLLLAWRNLPVFVTPTLAPPRGVRVSVLIPARNEGAQIRRAIEAALASRGVAVEVLVLDDQSGDDTARIVAEIAAREPRVRLIAGTALPPGWVGKQRACWLLAAQARHEVLMFVDADVSLRPRAAAAATGLLLQDAHLGLVSGFPRQRTGSLAEHLAVPWIHLLLLGYLPLQRMRESLRPAWGAACSQWMVARRHAYLEVNGHGAAPASRDAGRSLPRSFREHGWKTDVFDGTALASCRTYRGLHELWFGFGKSAGEGLASPAALPVWTLLIGAGHVLPWLLLPLALLAGAPLAAVLAGLAVAANLALRGLLMRRFRQPALGLALHPVSAAMVLALNGWFLLQRLLGRPSHWRGRAYPARVRARRRVVPARPAPPPPQAHQETATTLRSAEPDKAPPAPESGPSEARSAPDATAAVA